MHKQRLSAVTLLSSMAAIAAPHLAEEAQANRGNDALNDVALRMKAIRRLRSKGIKHPKERDIYMTMEGIRDEDEAKNGH